MNFKRYHVSKNLFDANTIYSTYKQSDGTFQAARSVFYGLKVKPFSAEDIGKTFTFAMSISPVSGNVRVCGNIGGTVVNGDSTARSTITFTVASVDDTLYLNYGSGGEVVTTLSNIMLNIGSTPLPYEPYSTEVWHGIPYYIHNTSTDTITTLPAVLYPTGTTATVGLKGNTVQSGTPSPQNPVMPQGCGDLETSGAKAGQYKIPISSANTTTPVYLGEVETTRKIKKLVLTGEESFFRDREREGSWRFYSDALISAKDNTAICSHFENIGSDGVNNSDNIGFCIFYRAQFGCRVSKSIAGTVNEFKAWLAQQYAAGTPVCVWYVLANEETGIVNEPLMKIGDYADTLSNVSIPVTAGGDTLSVGTTVQPSEVTVNYKGWHPVADVHERESGAWT